MEYAKLGRYQIEAEIGRGAMGVVYRARDPRIDRVVVLKTLRRDLIDSPDAEAEFVERFQREARAAGKLSHPSIVTIHDVDHDEAAKVDFIAMEYVPGRSLQELLASSARLPPEQVIEVATQVADALDFAHERGVVHRDVKPGNIILRPDGVVKITDFGIARLGTSDLTRSGEYLGTPNYMSPEQIMGEGVDGRSDQFALAIVLYQLLTGVRPFSGENLTTITYKIVHEDPIPPVALDGSLSPAVSAALMKGLNKDKAKRFASCREMVDAVANALQSPAAGAEATRAAVGLEQFPSTVVRKRRSPKLSEPPRPGPEMGGDVSGQTLSLMHEVKRLESMDPGQARVSAAVEAKETDEADVFEVDDVAATVARERTPLPSRSYMDQIRKEEAAAPAAPAPDDAGLGPTPSPGLDEDVEATRLGPPSLAAAPVPIDEESTRLGPSTLDAPRVAPWDGGPPLPGADTDATRLGPPSAADAFRPAVSEATLEAARAPTKRGAGLLVLGLVGLAFLGMAGLGAVGFIYFGGGLGMDGDVVGTTPEPILRTPPNVAAQVTAHYDLGVRAYHDGRLDDADRELRTVLSLEGTHEGAKQYLVLVEAERARLATLPSETAAPVEAPGTPEAGAPEEAPESPVEEPPVEASETPAAAAPGPKEPPPTRVAAVKTTPKGGVVKGEAPKPELPMPVGGATLIVHLEHNFKSGTIVVKVDGKERLRSDFKASKKRNKLLRRVFDSEASFDVDVPPGEHEVHVQIVAPHDGIDTSGSRTFSFEDGKSCTVELGVGRVDRKIEIAKKCK